MEKKLLIVKLDAIGDYIIFRNFIEIIKLNNKYKDYKISLLGNILYRDIAQNYDSKYIDNFIWIEKKNYKDLTISKEIQDIFDAEYDTLIHPTYSRLKIVDELISKIKSKNKIGFVSDNSNQSKRELKITNNYYTDLISTQKSIHEFDRYKIFFRQILERDFDVQLCLPAEKKKNEEYAVIFPGASSIFKRWSPKKFKYISSYLSEKHNLNIKICGSKQDQLIAKNILKNSNIKNIEDKTGKTNLIELIDIISNSKILITNDTSALHIGIATNTKTLLIGSGHHKDRFSNYSRPYFRGVFPFFYIQRWHGLINTITINKVKKLIDELLI